MSDDWDLGKLDTARGVDYLDDFEKDIVLEINKVRTNPKRYAQEYLEPRLSHFDGKEYKAPGASEAVPTKEGDDAVKGAIEVLNKQEAVAILTPNPPLTEAAKAYLAESGPEGHIGHVGRDGSSPFDRINKHGHWEKWAGENISYDHATAAEFVVAWVIDDGIVSKGHRINLLNRRARVVGIAVGPHKLLKNMAVLVLAKRFKSLAEREEELNKLAGGPDREDPDASNWDLTNLDTAADLDWLSGLEKDVILEVNKARSDPPKYGKLYAPEKERINKKLADVVPTPPLTPQKGLSPKPTEESGARSQRGGDYGKAVGERRSAKLWEHLFTARSIVVKLLPHYHSLILGPNYENVGVLVQTHPKYGAEVKLAVSTGYEAAESAPGS